MKMEKRQKTAVKIKKKKIEIPNLEKGEHLASSH